MRPQNDWLFANYGHIRLAESGKEKQPAPTECSICGAKALYIAGITGFCKAHRAQAEALQKSTFMHGQIAREQWLDNKRRIRDWAARKKFRQLSRNS